MFIGKKRIENHGLLSPKGNKAKNQAHIPNVSCEYSSDGFHEISGPSVARSGETGQGYQRGRVHHRVGHIVVATRRVILEANKHSEQMYIFSFYSNQFFLKIAVYFEKKVIP